MHVLVSHWAREYKRVNPSVSIDVESKGTTPGIQALIEGEAEICAASRPLQASEVRSLVKKYGYLGIQYMVAKDALSIYLNPENPVRNLSLEQVRDIFTGKIVNWQDAGGLDKSIQLIISPETSGTHVYFKEHILFGDDYSPNTQKFATTQQIVKAITGNPNAIGFGGIGYGPDLVHCQINGIHPVEANVQNGTYPIIRYLYLYTVNTPRGEIKKFINWVQKDGQQLVAEVGYFPLWNVPF